MLSIEQKQVSFNLLLNLYKKIEKLKILTEKSFLIALNRFLQHEYSDPV